MRSKSGVLKVDLHWAFIMKDIPLALTLATMFVFPSPFLPAFDCCSVKRSPERPASSTPVACCTHCSLPLFVAGVEMEQRCCLFHATSVEGKSKSQDSISQWIMLAVSLVLLLFYQAPEGNADPITCYDDLGKAADWFYLYKLPHHESRFEGLKYLFMDKVTEGWADGRGLVNDSTGALGRTVGQLYQSTEQGYILYNDQPPTPEPETGSTGNVGRSGGHTKGVVLFDKQQGYWLVHSTPHFPPPKKAGAFSYPDSGIVNGQNFICVTYPLDHFQTIGEQLQINQPHVFDCHIPDSLAPSVESLAQLCKHGREERGNVSLLHDATKTTNRSVALTSLGGTTFINFAKGESFANDLYHSWVAPALQSDLLVQFWQRSTGVLTSDCSPSWKVLNIEELAPGQRFTFQSMDDHSKWAVSTTAATGSAGGWVCVGDINRNKAEERRGGGTVCLQDPTVWKAYRTAALKCISCEGGQCDCLTTAGK
ncbi:hypothetical protein ACEWY4_012227 [Coilia grayii]|uniref:Deoxyribonuclease-2-alpha n=1 Tax=Coilia grayii TaxID=363190 RepID=A0ABD1JZW4_9TELE